MSTRIINNITFLNIPSVDIMQMLFRIIFIFVVPIQNTKLYDLLYI